MLGKIEGKTSGWQRMRWLDSFTDSMNMNLSKFQEIMKDREVCQDNVAVDKGWPWKGVGSGPGNNFGLFSNFA